MKQREIVIQTEHLSQLAADWLAERCELVVCRPDDPRFAHHLAQAAGLVVRTYTQVNQAMLSSAPRLQVVGRAGVGLDNIDVPACRARGVKVVYTPDANTQAVVEYVFTLVLDWIRPRTSLPAAISAAQWNELRERIVGQRQLNELVFGILGFGRVGSRIAEVARALGCRVLFNDIRQTDAVERGSAEAVDVQTLFKASDLLSIHIDGRRSNRHFVDAGLLDLLKPSALFVNTSRGFVVDNFALRGVLEKKPGVTALLDVHEPEPFNSDYPLLGCPNARLFPHLASRTQTAMENMSWVVCDVLAVLQGGEPRFEAP